MQNVIQNTDSNHKTIYTKRYTQNTMGESKWNFKKCSSNPKKNREKKNEKQNKQKTKLNWQT